MGAGLDDEKLSLLANWAAGLRCDTRAEVVAAGRAIEMLIDEVERLNVLLWDGPLALVPTRPDALPVIDDAGRPGAEDLPQTLRGRIAHRTARLVDRDSNESAKS